VVAHAIASIPIDAHWLDPRDLAPEVTIVELRHKGDHLDANGQRIVKHLNAYFQAGANGRSVQISVSRGEPADAALRVAAVLDGIDGSWEDHFYLPSPESEIPLDEPAHAVVGRRHLHLVKDSDEPQPSRPDPESDQDMSLAPTENTRTWPNALEMQKAFD
jgi:hypothetical protein